jgi:hypothetical protein
VTKSNNGLVWWLVVMAGLQSLVSAGAIADVVGIRWIGVAGAIVAALNVSTAAYVAATKPVGTEPAASPQAR